MLLDIRQPDSGAQCFCEKHPMIEKRLSELIDEVRQLAWGMHPSILDDYGLDKALERYVNNMSKVTRIAIDYQCLCPRQLPRLPNRTEVALYRIAQEAITNIVRHANTKQASVVFMRNEHETILLVEDAGKGFDPAANSGSDFNHMGLLGMSERTSMLSGEFIVESVPGRGTTIRVKIPQEMLS
jgi:signal transduction histidine kinase